MLPSKSLVGLVRDFPSKGEFKDLHDCSKKNDNVRFPLFLFT